VQFVVRGRSPIVLQSTDDDESFRFIVANLFKLTKNKFCKKNNVRRTSVSLSYQPVRHRFLLVTGTCIIASNKSETTRMNRKKPNLNTITIRRRQKLFTQQRKQAKQDTQISHLWNRITVISFYLTLLRRRYRIIFYALKDCLANTTNFLPFHSG
jgi:hypothetical protein